ncbi:hypothetical protein A0J61_08215 [Choanephora cucurbitarum]|uniref:FHA domain-containing protein n=1 Tax=Choanephora cucurbitarum TaxID=101091 RepID=A0A1C7N3L2_9FUNG|nr:hypothetical protein A0J61_08215 [Choanephora cucurbitarum]
MTFHINTDRRFQAQTSQFLLYPSLAKKCHESDPNTLPVICTGSKKQKTTIGRGPDATIQIGRCNKRVSREHVVIEHRPQLDGYELTILSPNGALIDHIIFVEGEHVPVTEGTMIEIVGTRLVFKTPTEEDEEERDKSAVIEKKITTVIQYEERKEVKMVKKKITTYQNQKKPITLEDQIIQVLMYTRKSTMTCSDICKRIEEYSRTEIANVLSNSSLVGCVKREGKTADGSPKEDLFYYKADLDQNQERRKRYSDIGRSARKCTMKDTQYYFKIPPKLNHHKSKTLSNKKRTMNEPKQEDDQDEIGSNSSGDVSDMEVYELFRDV